jgi:MoxR-like ATPase
LARFFDSIGERENMNVALNGHDTKGVVPSLEVIQEKVQAAIKSLNEYFIESEEEILCAWTALVARQHFVMVGLPGVAKSALIDGIMAHLHGVSFFSNLFHPLSKEEDILGPMSLPALQQERYERNVAGTLAEARVAFGDEIFNAGPAVLLSLNLFLNERKFKNGTGVFNAPLDTFFGASNRWPQRGESMDALHDRFLLRINRGDPSRHARRVIRRNRLAGVRYTPLPGSILTGEELTHLQEAARTLPFWNEDEFMVLLDRLLLKLEEENIRVSPRRDATSIDVVRAYALVCGDTKVQPHHLRVLRHVWWEHANQVERVNEVFGSILKERTPEEKAQAFLAEAQVVFANATASNDSAEVRRALRGIEILHRKCEEIERHLRDAGADARAVQTTTADIGVLIESLEEM